MSRDNPELRFLLNNSEGVKALLLFIDNRINGLDNKFTAMARGYVLSQDDEAKTSALLCQGQIQGLRELRDDIQRLVNYEG